MEIVYLVTVISLSVMASSIIVGPMDAGQFFGGLALTL